MILLKRKTYFPYCGQRFGPFRVTDTEYMRLLPLMLVRIKRA